MNENMKIVLKYHFNVAGRPAIDNNGLRNIKSNIEFSIIEIHNGTRNIAA